MGCVQSVQTSGEETRDAGISEDAQFNHDEEDSAKKIISESQVEAPETLTSNDVSIEEDSIDSVELELSSLDVKQFEYRQLQKATLNFKDPDMILGEGGFGKVFKGFIKSPGSKKPWPVAVKRLHPESGIEGHTEWINEVKLLAKLKHENLIHMWGFCAHEGEAIMVLEYMPLGSLDYHLFTDLPKRPLPPQHLSLKNRLKIAVHTISALHFLHQNNVIHRDIKAANVLLDKELNAKLTDFGLVREQSDDRTHVTVTKALGTLGYIDPSYAETGHLNSRSDVYSLGILLIELLTGKRSRGFQFATWAEETIVTTQSGNIDWVDPRIAQELESKDDRKAVKKLARIAVKCVSKDSRARPQVSDFLSSVVSMLDPSNTS